MNFLLIEVTGRHLRFRGGDLEGRHFARGEVVSISGDTVTFGIPDLNGTWLLHSSFHHGRPAVICSFYNKRTLSIERRYCKIFRDDGLYMCGPRYPRSLTQRKGRRAVPGDARPQMKRAA